MYEITKEQDRATEQAVRKLLQYFQRNVNLADTRKHIYAMLEHRLKIV